MSLRSVDRNSRARLSVAKRKNLKISSPNLSLFDSVQGAPIVPHSTPTMLGLSWLHRKLNGQVSGTKRFASKCEQAFNEVDHDASGTVDKTELHVAVLLVFDRLNAAHRAGGHVYPPTRDEILELFKKVDTDGNGVLTLDEFTEFMDLLCKDASDGVVMNMLKTFAIVPGVAAGVANASKRFAKNIDSEMSKHKGLSPAVYAGIAGFIVGKLPAPVGNGTRRY